MQKSRALTFILILVAMAYCRGQQPDLYIPVSINSPLFRNTVPHELQFGMKVNNYGWHLNFAGQSNNKVLIASFQQNNGHVKFDPLHFNDYFERGQEYHYIQTYPGSMVYGEIGIGYNFFVHTQKISLIGGIGMQFLNPNTRLFLQVDWGNESRMINAGVSVRGNYTRVDKTGFFTIEPVVQGKVKIRDFRIVNQFGYSVALKSRHDYMKPILTVGIEYII